MSKRLQPATIIPAEMYVERSADRQLREVITGMGRPGYILVARQMGKTNLLLNARRTLESEALRFIYVDLSAQINSPEEYYGLLLNTAFSVHPQIFALSNVEDSLLRKSYTAFEFEGILRSVLQKFAGRIVFVLDEIDSLGNFIFSDRIFSQIRSMYFSRSNFEEYSRVTYILSGVAEPADLIKDKNVSPFNIGEKIYLNDFTRDEFSLFLEKAELKITDVARDRIFYWAGGNPRITWDICSEVETAIADGVEITENRIDAFVQKLYLTTFDRAPIDHIRSIVQSDREIRQAIRQLRTGATADISDKTRNKLYLAGIIGMHAASSVSVAIKNMVIDESLSERWLADVEKQSRGLLQLARESYEEKRYEPAIAFYEEYLTQGDIDKKSLEAYRLATSYFHARRYAKAIEWLNLHLSAGIESGELRAAVYDLLGRANIVSGDMEAAARNLRALMSSKQASDYPMAPGLLASTLLSLDFDKYQTEATTIANEGLAGASNATNPTFQANARVICWDCLAAIERKKDNIEHAIGIVDQAVAEGSIAYKAFLSLRLLELLPQGERREKLLDCLADDVIELGSVGAEQRLDNSFRQVALPALVELRLANRQHDFIRLLEFLEQNGECNSAERYKTFDELYTVCNQKRSSDAATVFLRDIIEEFDDNPAAQESVLSATTILIVRNKDYSYSRRYIELITNRDPDLPLDETDYVAVGYITSHFLQRDEVKGLELLDRLPLQLRAASAQKRFGYAFASYFEMLRKERLGRIDSAIKDAHELIDLLSDPQAEASGLTPDVRSAMEKNTRSLLRRYEPKARVVNPYKGIGRNTIVLVRYTDGREVRAKFKSVQRDLVLEACELVEPELRPQE
jgi:TolA-binding protein